MPTSEQLNKSKTHERFPIVVYNSNHTQIRLLHKHHYPRSEPMDQ